MKGRVIVKGTAPGGQAVSALVVDGQVEDMEVDPGDNRPFPPPVGAITYGTITRVLPNGRGAFCDVPRNAAGSADGEGRQSGFLRDAKGLRQGDRLAVQASAIPEPGKAVPLRRNLLIKGPRVILTPGAPGINASRKLTDEGERARLTAVVSEALAARLAEEPVETAPGAIIRTSAAGVEEARIAGEVRRLFATYGRVLLAANAPHMGWFAKDGLFASDVEAEWLSNAPDALVCAPETAHLARSGPSDGDPFNLWSDPVFAARAEADPAPLDSFGVLECLEALKSPDVPLPEGSLAIEPTRALVAVDVNTGADFSPAAGLKANLAAARALPRQLRLRGLGGQIVVDFAPMPKKDRRTLEEALRKAFRADPVETSLVGWTPLGHYELQRKRERHPLHEVL